MKLFRQLRWRIVAAHMIVVIVGVVIVLVMARVVTVTVVPNDVSAKLAVLREATDPTAVARATDDVLNTFRNSIFTAVSVAALAAVGAGILTSMLLAREILRPLRQIARSSERIARGHYSERVAEPASDELALVADSFNQMAESLAQVEQQRVALIGNVSHELRTPLTGLNGYLEGLIDGVFPNNEETFVIMQKEVRRMRRLVDDLQSLSRAEAGQISLNFSTFDLAPLINRHVAQIKPQAEAECIKVVVAPEQEAVWVHADPDRTAQVLLNLMGNAIRYTPQEGCVQVLVAVDGRFARVSVQDTGIGIPAEALPYVFERFYRVDASRTRRSGGSGIGLTIARHLVWAMGGEISVASAGKDQGSTFTFTLPLANG